MPKTVVVPLDGSTFAERALRPAAEVARRAGAHVVVMTARLGGVVVEPLRYLEEAARAAGIEEPEPVVVEGRLAAGAIASVACEHPDAAVVMTTHARDKLRQALFGSVAEEVLGAASTPALLVGPSVPDEPVELAELIVCLDGSTVALRSSRSPRRGHAIFISTSCSSGSRSPTRRPPGTNPTPVRADLADLQRDASELEPIGGSVRCEVLHRRDAAEAIVEFAHRHPHALLALTTHGRTGVARLAAGSVAIAVVRDARTPVLLMRPADLD